MRYTIGQRVVRVVREADVEHGIVVATTNSGWITSSWVKVRWDDGVTCSYTADSCSIRPALSSACVEQNDPCCPRCGATSVQQIEGLDFCERCKCAYKYLRAAVGAWVRVGSGSAQIKLVEYGTISPLGIQFTYQLGTMDVPLGYELRSRTAGSGEPYAPVSMIMEPKSLPAGRLCGRHGLTACMCGRAG